MTQGVLTQRMNPNSKGENLIIDDDPLNLKKQTKMLEKEVKRDKLPKAKFHFKNEDEIGSLD